MWRRLIQKIRAHPLGAPFARRQFLNYFWVSVIVSVVNIFALWLLIDWLHVPTLVASVLVVGATFISRYVLFQYFPIA